MTRFTRSMIWGGCLLGASLSLSAQAREVRSPDLTLAPSSDWNLDYAEDSCRLTRLFGTGEDKVVFYIERYQPTEIFFLLVAGEPLGKRKRGDIVFRFGPGGAERESTGEQGTLGAYDPAFFEPAMTLLSQPETTEQAGDELLTTDTPFGRVFTDEQEQAIEWLDVRRGSHTVRLELTPMGAPMKAMRDCTDTLLTDWGLDAEAHRTMRAAPKPNDPGRWVTQRDYPRASLRKGQQSLLHA